MNKLLELIYYYFFRILNLKIDKKIVYESYEGKNFTGNPYALFLEIKKHKSFNDYKHIIVLNEHKHIQGAITVKRNSFKYFYYLATSQYLINNVCFSSFFKKRKNQIYINTWHGIPLKFIGKNIKEKFLSGFTMKQNFKQVDFFVSPNSYTTDVLFKSINLKFKGNVINEGYPRYDLLFDEKFKNKFFTKNNIDKNKKVLLYAPTFRDYEDDFDIKKFILDLEEQFSNYNIFLKLHHVNFKNLDNLNSHNVYMIKNSIDTNLLLSCVDVLITDYSSIAFDFMLLKKPILYFVYDLEKYKKTRGLYFNINQMPGIVCNNNKQLFKALDNIDEFNFSDEDIEVMKKFVDFNKINISQQVIHHIFKDLIESSYSS